LWRVLLITVIALVLLLQAGTASTSARTRAAPVCPPVAEVLKGVYHPQRLTVLSPCKKAAGTVMHVKHEGGTGDGDLHIQLKLDPAYASLKNAKNDSGQGGSLVVEYMPRDGGHLPRPVVGQHLVLRGAWVLDTAPSHGWREIHPVWSVTVNGHTYMSGPQNGGSPANDNASNSEADCVDHGHACSGY
jgi:hypothetical protein